MNTSILTRTFWGGGPFCLVFALSCLPCLAQPPIRTAGSQSDVEQLRETVARLTAENRSLKYELENTKLVIAELQKSQREAIAGLNVVHEIHRSHAEVREMQRATLLEVKRLRELFEALHGKTPTAQKRPVTQRTPASKPESNDPFSRGRPTTERKPTSKPAPNDPFAR